MTCSEASEARRKEMNKTIHDQDPRVTRMIALLAVLLLLLVALVFALQLAPTTSDRDFSPANHAMSADDTGGSTITEDPYIERHAEVVQRLGDGHLR
jgi:Trk-type K+ transport system membrane component